MALFCPENPNLLRLVNRDCALIHGGHLISLYGNEERSAYNLLRLRLGLRQ